MGPKRTMLDFFKPTNVDNNQSQSETNNVMEDGANNPQSIVDDEIIMEESPRIETEKKNDTSNLGDINLDSLVRDPCLRPSFMDYPINQHDKIRRAYVKHGPYQLRKSKYVQSLSSSNSGNRSFQQAWFSKFWWLEYSEIIDAAYLFPCYLFYKNPIGRAGSETFIKKGFRNWKKVNCGQDCSFLKHEGKTSASAHNYYVRCYENLKNQLCHIENVIEKQTNQEIADNRLRVRTSIEMIKWLIVQACALRGHDERPGSKNQGNFLELIKLVASYNNDVEKVVLENDPQNARCTSPDVQKEILQIFATNVQKSIREEIGNAKFCLIVDECRDESKKEQMVIVVRFVHRDGYVKERFLDLVHVKDTSAITLKDEILSSLSFHKLDVQDIRGQGYDGAMLREIAVNGSTPSQKGDASFALTELLSFDFVFVMHLMKKIMRKTDKLCQAFNVNLKI
ncbi:uncharacterized protein [Rutidosis leptorrhynchoides]|uniref:uncharacterized protein n=1 Tax=Rutidosis leptorrhynchoides TaxID=125765 RepID=UPI003A99360F